MSISPQIHYNAAKDLLRGFTINGEKIADHVLVFMVKGLRKKFKQPIAYYFTNALNKAQLKEILKKVVSYVRSTGLKVVCTVCDQSTVNVNNLFDSLNSNTFHVPDGKIYKGCVRRNSLHHDLWKNAIKVLNTVKFVKKIKDNNKIRLIETKAIPSIKNLIRTIEGINKFIVSNIFI
ncbi:hypothetical protein SFRURICE_007400 [Spodoptera frugiperda]|nr:hypothetical protein SFRURICE_007400 [Spodoptera frugiperda]